MNLIKFCFIHCNVLMMMRLAWKNSVFHKTREDFYRVGDTENFSAANYS